MGELFVGCDLGVRRGDTDVSLVDARTCWLRWPLVLEYISLVFWRVPESCVVDGRNIEILRDSRDPGGDPFLSGTVIWYDE